jgi:predicted metal-dependent HD superfamily phosphohydrolase
MGSPTRFFTVLQRLHCRLPNPAQAWQALVAAYAEPHRHYHTAQHIEECLQLLDSYRYLVNEPAAVEFALYWHDAVYQPQSLDNEQKSAEWAVSLLQQGGVNHATQQRIYRLILATQHSVRIPETADEKCLVDLDLAIFAASPARFAQYQQQIRTEYAHVPDSVYYPKRAAFLTTFAQRPTLYQTPAIQAALEKSARRNLHHALLELKN